MRQGSVQKNADSKADEKKHLVRGRNKAPKPPRQGLVPAPSQPPPFYGLEGLSRLCYRYLKHLFNCPDSSPDRKRSRTGLLHYIAQILYLSRFNSAVIIMALMLLTRLKHQASPMMVSGHRLFTTALIIASGYLCDNTYRSRSWRDMSGGLFSVEALNTMVREMLGRLDWDISVDGDSLERFSQAVSTDFSQDRAEYPSYPLEMYWKKLSEEGSACHPLGSDESSVSEESTAGSSVDLAPLSTSLCLSDTVLPFPRRLKSQCYAFSTGSQY
ncbi:hypothetical protein D9611_012773 [Ephemerocybe angulata]|uniref:Cyclin N-terminal domain-containing protein n=1 Tax=Ephemerocybe angulata TaxID=980116 RepID=A0A8H5CB96_9AGAR|nr:hypothetical protein D9611_012773 [Tulosesus angulatus]